MLIVDTNIFLYAVNREDPYHKKSVEFLKHQSELITPWHSTWAIFYEFLRVSTHPNVFTKPLTSLEAWNFLESLCLIDNFSIIQEKNLHAAHIKMLVQNNSSLKANLWHDAKTVATMMDHGIFTIATADTDFHKFYGIKVFNPLR